MNQIFIKGRLTKDVEVKYTQNNTAVANFSVAVNRKFVVEGSEQKADFFNVTAWGKTGEFVSKYFKKGQEILVEGRLENRSWDDSEGKKHYATDIIAEQVEFCGSKSEKTDDDNSVEIFKPVENNSYDDLLPF